MDQHGIHAEFAKTGRHSKGGRFHESSRFSPTPPPPPRLSEFGHETGETPFHEKASR